jgi:NAD(P)-dependent dehydrogenase (short-subunit alcohol dehydrogenase family)
MNGTANLGKINGRGRLDGKIAIVTGAGTRLSKDPEYGKVEEVASSDKFPGTGRAISICFAREGATVLLVDMSIEQAEITLEAIQKEGGKASIFQADVSDVHQCEQMVETAVERYGALHVLVNNVGISGSGRVTEITEEVWDRSINTNLKSMVFSSKYAIPEMTKSGGGSIVNLSSVDGIRGGISPNIAYSAGKGGVGTLTKATAVYHGKDNIRANCIAPGHIFAPMTTGSTRKYREQRRRSAPLGTEGTAWDIALAAVFLASDESRWISGVILPVDGGVLAALPLHMAPAISNVDQLSDL